HPAVAGQAGRPGRRQRPAQADRGRGRQGGEDRRRVQEGGPGPGLGVRRMSLAASASFTLGDKRYDSHAAELAVTLALLPGVSSFRVDLPAAADVTCQPGDPARLDVDGGEGAETVLVGTVRSVQRGFARTRVVAADASADLCALRSVSTFVGQAGGDVVARLCDEA